MKKIIFLVFLSLTISVFGQNSDIQSPDKIDKAEKQFPNFTYKIIPSINNTWCYDVYKNSKMLIHQTNIPGVPGNEGFKSKSDAIKVARLVIEKLEKGEMPPSITIDEMKKLNVLLTN